MARSHSSPPKARQSASSSLAADAAEARASASDTDPSASPQRRQRLSALASLSAELQQLEADFLPPAQLIFQPNSTKLAFTPSNAPFLAFEDALVKLLTKLDGVESDGDPVVRAERKKVVSAVDAVLERLDGMKKAEMERGQARGQQETELREKKERVDQMLRNAALAGGKAQQPIPETPHQVAENALYNEHGKRVENSRGRGSPRSGDEGSARGVSNGRPKSQDRYSKVRRHESPNPPYNKPLPPSPSAHTVNAGPPHLSATSGHPRPPYAPNVRAGNTPFFASLPSRFDRS
ncbi:hypothetical protein P7C70_g3247, partial [Phenoliferia sp. Uapishka_3]